MPLTCLPDQGRGWAAEKNGANGRNRTADLLITNQLLYRLSYIGFKGAVVYSRSAVFR